MDTTRVYERSPVAIAEMTGKHSNSQKGIITGQWAHCFRNPDSNVRQLLEDLVTSLDTTDMQAFLREQGAPKEEEAVLMGLDDSLAFLSDSLRKDYEVNTKEETEANWTFDYVVEVDKPGQLNLLTRLRPKDPEDRSGNIHYGLTIIRLSTDRYAIWSDYE